MLGCKAQLLELRSQNYRLSDELRKNLAELNDSKLKAATLERDLNKAQKAVNKSKKAQEVDALLSENEMLQGKLHSQEEDFRLQNSTLMEELSKLCAQIEQLEKENRQMKEGLSASELPATSPVDGELLRLQAENTALQKKLASLQEWHEKELQVLRQPESRLNGHRASDADVSAEMGKFDEIKKDTDKQLDGEAQHVDHLQTEQLEQAEKMKNLEQKLKELHEIQLKWETEREEKVLLKEQLQALEASKQTECSKLQQEISKLSEKLKKKQESFLQLQTEKETLFNDSRAKLDEVKQRKEEELKSLNIRNQKLQADLQTANQSLNELKEQLTNQQKEHENAVQILKDQVACQSAESQEQVESILSENDALRTNLAALEQIQTAKMQEMNLLREQNAALTTQLQQKLTEKEEFMAQWDDLNSQLQEAQRANGKLLEQMQKMQQEITQLQQDLEEARKTAEKRKAMLDEMAIDMQQEKTRHKEEVSNVKVQHEKEVLSIRAKYEKELRELHEEKNRMEEDLRRQLKEEKSRSCEVETLKQTIEELTLQIQSTEGTKGWFERRLKEAEEVIEQNQKEHEENINKVKEQHIADLQSKDQAVEKVKEQLQDVEEEKNKHQETISKLRQEIKDTIDGQKIIEKKGSSALKELKRQLHLERKRADKLQERLQEILTNSKTRTGIEELVLAEISSPSRTQTGDSSSISSYSYREMMKEQTAPSSNKSNTGSPQSQSQRPADLSDDEVTEVFQRLAEIQQEKWMLEEKVKHLEVSCASMAEDICRKSAIIETYVMESRIDATAAHGPVDRSTLSSVLRDLVKPGDENVREMNKKLQNMLEEQLTKNMHLQKDLEVLSQEIVRLSKECVSSPSKDLSPGETS
ncbi:GRIP1-associated protein 1 isoform X2 [Protopterus annectens]|uniref:GRIP1-associated protein 1 isoform X2 n=1 Tax=Protopterus annectens TaxID=7888 RepID=UPI001CFB8E7D|nr:GRIP1-associated protein 1 isoform X2 [Protopterus annectens]